MCHFLPPALSFLSACLLSALFGCGPSHSRAMEVGRPCPVQECLLLVGRCVSTNTLRFTLSALFCWAAWAFSDVCLAYGRMQPSRNENRCWLQSSCSLLWLRGWLSQDLHSACGVCSLQKA